MGRRFTARDRYTPVMGRGEAPGISMGIWGMMLGGAISSRAGGSQGLLVSLGAMV